MREGLHIRKLLLSGGTALCRFITQQARTVKQNLRRFRADLVYAFGPEIAWEAGRAAGRAWAAHLGHSDLRMPA